VSNKIKVKTRRNL